MNPHKPQPSPAVAPPQAQTEAQLARLVACQSFSGALRSQEFLRFVVNEALAGRQHRIGAYTIGLEVFERPDDFDPQIDPIVRVEAGRLRQRLERHYLTEGADDPILIDASNSVVRLSKSYDARLEGILDLQAEIARDIADSLSSTITPTFERQLRTTGARDSEVLALYHQASTLRDPPSDPVRSRLAEEAYQRVIELDPEFAGGYAGLAYVLAFRSWWGLSEHPETDAREALEAGRLAVQKDPEFGWAQMSLGIALNVTGDHDGSLDAARRAIRLSPSDPYVLALGGVIRAFGNEVDAGISPARSAIRLDRLSSRTPFRNITGIILFHAGRFEEALEVLYENVRLGGPDGPHMAYYRAGTLARLGRTEEARRELEKASAFPYEVDMRNFLSAFRDPREANELLDSLESLGVDVEVFSAPRDP